MWTPFKTKATPEREDTETPRQPDVMYLNSGIGVAVVQWSDYVSAENALRHPVIFRALNKLAESVQQVPFKVRLDPNAPASETTGKARIVADLQALLDNPNEDMTPAMLRYWMTLQYACYGRIPFKVGVKATDMTRPNGIYPLEAKHVRVHLSERGGPKSYDYGAGESKQSFPSFNTHQRSPTTKGFVTQIWKPALKGYQHKDERNSPLSAVGLPAQVIRSLLMRAIQTAEGHPNVRYLVVAEKQLNENQKAALKQHLNDDHGPDGPDAGKIPILQAAGKIEIHTLDNDLSDIHSKTPSDDMARIIFGAFGIPIALAGMGAADGAKFAGNYVESRQAFWQDTIIPSYVSPVCQGLTRVLCPPGVIIVPDLDQIPALKEGRILSMKNASSITFLTTTEKRELFGLEANSALPETTGAPASGNPSGETGNEQ